MKKQVLILILSITASLFSLTSCGNTTEAEESVNTEVEESVVYTPDPTPTATPESTPTPTPTPTATPESTPTSTPTSESSDSLDDIASAKSYTLSEQEKADLRALGATEEQINNVKSGQDFIDLVYKLVDGGSTGNSGSTAGGGSGSGSSADTGSSDSTSNGNDNDLPIMQLDPDDGSLPGYM